MSEMGSKSNVVLMTCLGLRIFTFICLLISLVVVATNKMLLIDGFKVTYSDILGYRYLLSVAIISLSYTILQIGLSIYQLVTRKILIWDGLPELNFYSDQVISWLLATGVGAGFGVTVELQRLADKAIENSVGDLNEGGFGVEVDEQKSIVDDFFTKGNTASGVLLVAFMSVATIVLLSSLFNRNKAAPASGTAPDSGKVPASGEVPASSEVAASGGVPASSETPQHQHLQVVAP